MTQLHRTDALQFLANRPLTPFSTLALRAVVALVKWEERRKTRVALGRLDAHLLKDIGLPPEAAQREAQRPFWQG